VAEPAVRGVQGRPVENSDRLLDTPADTSRPGGAGGKDTSLRNGFWRSDGPLVRLVLPLAGVLAVLFAAWHQTRGALKGAGEQAGATMRAAEVETSRPQCAKAAEALTVLRAALSPAFPEQLCLPPVDDGSTPWESVKEQLAVMRPAIDGCRQGDPERANRMQGEMAVAEAIVEREDSKNADRYKEWMKSAETTLGKDDALITLRVLEDRVNALGTMAGKEPKPCSRADGPSEADWRAANTPIEAAFQRLQTSLAAAMPDQQRGIRGCAWALRAEQAYWNAGFCGTDFLGGLAESAVEYRRARSLGRDHATIDLALTEVRRSASRPPPVSLVEPRQRADNEKRIERDAAMLGDELDAHSQFTSALDLFSQGRQGLLEWLRQLYAEEWAVGRTTKHTVSETGYRLAEVLILSAKPEAADKVLEEVASESKEATEDYRYNLLRSKVACFASNSQAMLNQLDLASALETASLASRWGHASVLKSLCAAMHGRLSAPELRSYLMNADHVAVAQDVCDAMWIPTAAERLRALGIGQECEMLSESPITVGRGGH